MQSMRYYTLPIRRTYHYHASLLLHYYAYAINIIITTTIIMQPLLARSESVAFHSLSYVVIIGAVTCQEPHYLIITPESHIITLISLHFHVVFMLIC